MDRQRMEQCLAHSAAHRASGQRSEPWALASGEKPRELASGCSHARRWQSMPDGDTVPAQFFVPRHSAKVGALARA